MAIQIRRREFITLIGGAAAAPSLLWPFAGRAQQIDRTMRRVGVLMPFTPDDPEARLRVAALEQGLRDLGWVDSRNLRIDYRWATDDPDRLPGEAAALVAAAPDVIIANSTPVLSELRKQSTTLPMVFVQVTDPLGSGFVPNLARPSGDLTGFHQLRVCDQRQMAADAQGGRAGGQADRSRVQSADRALC